MVRAVLREASCDEDLVEDAQLAVSELVTNALVHAGTVIGLAVSVTPDLVRVSVSDGSPHLPRTLDYATTAGTGRGLRLVAGIASEWGVEPRTGHSGEGKTVWFDLDPGRVPKDRAAEDERNLLAGVDLDVLGELDAAVGGDDAERTSLVGDAVVELLEPPVVLYQAWRQHADALLRELLLVTLDDGSAADAVRVHAEASDALALFDETMPPRVTARTPQEALAAAAKAASSPPTRVEMRIPLRSAAHFKTLDDALEEALRLGEARRFLTPPIQPELRQLRQWLCGQVATQTGGDTAQAWLPSTENPTSRDSWPPPSWEVPAVTGSPRAVLAVDDAGRICAASAHAAEVLGYPGSDDLLGIRLVALVPARFRDAHLAGFTLHLLTGDGALLDTPIVVPLLGYDGTETRMQLTVHEEPTDDARSMFIADLDPSAAAPGAAGLD